MEVNILEADISSRRKDLFSSSDQVQVSLSRTQLTQPMTPDFVTNHAGNIKYDQGEVKNMFWNQTFTIYQNDLSLTNSQDDRLYVCLVKNSNTKMEIIARCEPINLGSLKSQSDWNSNSQVAIFDIQTNERMGHLFFNIRLPPPGSEYQKSSRLQRYDMNLGDYNDEGYDGFNASSVSMPLTVASLRRDDRSQGQPSHEKTLKIKQSLQRELTLEQIINQKSLVDGALSKMFPDFPVIDKCTSFQEFAQAVHMQSIFLTEHDRMVLIQEQFDLSHKNTDLQKYKSEIDELKAAIKNRDLRIDADARVLKQGEENEVVLKRLRSQMASMQVEQNKELQRQKESFDTTIASKTNSYESQLQSMKVELAQNIGTMHQKQDQLKQALETSANLKKQLDKFSSPHRVAKRGSQSSQLDGINESIPEEDGIGDDFERDEDATDINISQSLGLGKSSAKNQSDSWFSKSRGSRGDTFKQEELMNLREADHDQEELDADEDDNRNRTPLSLKNDSDLNFTQTQIEDSFLYSEDNTQTLGGNSTLNFGFSGSKGYSQNNVQGMLQAAQGDGRIKMEEEAAVIEKQVNIQQSVADESQLDDTTLNFNLTATQHGLPDSFQAFSQSAKVEKSTGKPQSASPFQQANDFLKSNNMGTTMLSGLSRDSGMESGNFCLAADNFRAANDDLQQAHEKCKRLEQDKQRLNGQLNQMLTTYKGLQTQLDLTNKITENDEEGLSQTFTDLFKQIKTLEKTNDQLSNDNVNLKGEIDTLKSLTVTKNEILAPEAKSTSPILVQLNSDIDFSRDEAAPQPPKETEASPIAKQLTDFVIRLNAKEKQKYDEYIDKYAEKLYKIYKRLNVKIVSKEVLKKEIDGSKHLLQVLDSISGNYNKISHQIQQLLEDNDNEIESYKNIIAKRLKPQMQKLLEENNEYKQKMTLEDKEKTQQSQLKGENKFLQDRMAAMQRQLETLIDNSSAQQRYLSEIKKLRNEMRNNQSAISQLGHTLVVAPENAELTGLYPRQSRSSSPPIRKKKAVGYDRKVKFNAEDGQKKRVKSSYHQARSTENKSTLSSPNHHSQKSSHKLAQVEKKRHSKSVQKNPFRQRALTTNIKKAKSKSPLQKQPMMSTLTREDNYTTFQPEETFHLFPQSSNIPPDNRPSFSTTGKLSIFQKKRTTASPKKMKNKELVSSSSDVKSGPVGIDQQILEFKRENDACKIKIQKLEQRVSGASSPHNENSRTGNPGQLVAKSVQLPGKGGLDIFSKESSLSDRMLLKQAKRNIKRNNYVKPHSP